MNPINVLPRASLGPLRRAGSLGLVLLAVGLALGGLVPAPASAFGGDAPLQRLAGAPDLSNGGGIVARPVTSGALQDRLNGATATATVAIGASKLALLWVAQSDGVSGAPTLTDPQREWTMVTTTVATLQRLTLYRSMKPTETSGSIAITSPVPTAMAWTLVEYANVDTRGPNGAGAIAQFEATNFKRAGVGMTTYASSVLSQTARKGSVSVGGFAVQQSAQAVTAGKGYSLTGAKACSTMCIQAELRGKFSRLVDLSWSGKSAWLAVAVELKKGG